ncbi:MAG: hypothetical protein M3Y08_02380 [Fibrobacterota bacterium]|nr:hypothetical protein [Fibrobacterota bacterium]
MIPAAGFLTLACSLLLIGGSGCSSSFCGAPCEKPPAAAPKPKLPLEQIQAVVNQYGTIFGHLEIPVMTPAQLQVEKNSLEALLIVNDRDADILRSLKARKDNAFSFNYDDYATGGSRFNASGKLRRDAAVEDPQRRIPRMISESQNRELFERYRQVRLQILRTPPKTEEPAPAPVAAALDTVQDSLWSGSYRANGDAPVPAPEKFPGRGECEKWAVVQSESFRSKAFSYEYECQKNAESVKRKAW